jgi:flagellar hook-associated protein 1 FlgK
MRSTFAGLNTMVRGIYTHQIALDTVGNNITNINTEGYSRQRTNVVETPLEFLQGSKGALAIGTGCATESIVRLRDELIDAQVRKGMTPLGYADTMQETLGRIEDIFTEPSDTGLQTALDNFYTAWQKLGANAADNGARSVVRQRGIELVDAIQRAGGLLEDIQTDANLALTAKVQSLNQHLTELAAVNKQIIASPTDQVNALKDRQDLLLEKISLLTPIQATKESSGSVTVTISGITVVNQDRANLLDSNVSETGNLKMAGTGMEVKLGEQGGELQGLIDSRDSLEWGVPAYLEKLGAMSQFLLNDFNAAHRSGYGLDNTTNVNFFGDSVLGAGTDALGATLQLASSANIAASTQVPANTTLTLGDGTSTMTVNLAQGWTLEQVAEAINAQADFDNVNVRAQYDAASQQFQLFSTGDSKKLTATESTTTSFLSHTLKLESPSPEYWLSQLTVNSAILDKEGLNKIAAKSSAGSSGLTPQEVKSSDIWRGNTAGGAMTATVTGTYTFDPATMPIRVRITGLTTNSDGTKVPSGLEYSTDGQTWTAAEAGSEANSFKFTVEGATVTMSIAANAANAENDIYVVTLPYGNDGVAGGDLAVNLANLLKLTKSEVLGSASLDGFYNNLIGTLGTQSQNAQYQSINQQSLVDQTRKLQDSVSGVNLDEELTAMIKYQKGYNGCARMLTAMDEMLDKLINSTGVVGR